MASDDKRDQSAAEFLPSQLTLPELRKAADTCRGCDLYQNATQTVFGEGPQAVAVVFVGEQPGDFEDKAGHPFVGPAGRMFDKALAEAELSRETVYVTNAVKHFKWIWRGKRRLHQKPSVRQIAACKPWLDAEVQLLRPKIVVCLGSTAAQSVLGKPVLITAERGKFIESGRGFLVFITIHPSSIYRHREKAEQDKEYQRFAEEMKQLKRRLDGLPDK